LSGTGSFAGAVIGFGVPFIVLFPTLYWRALRNRTPAPGSTTDAAWQRVYAIAMLAGAGAMLLSVFALGSHDFKPRWMHQVMMPLPIYLFLRVKAAQVSEKRHTRFVAIALLFALAVVIARFAIYWTDADSCRTCREYWPMAAEARAFRDAGFRQGTIVAERYDRGGNIRYHFPDSRIAIPGYPVATFGEPRGRQCMIVWWGARPMPEVLNRFLRHALNAKIPVAVELRTVSAPLQLAPQRRDQVTFVVLPSGIGDCN
jgi:hypothetical protein